MDRKSATWMKREDERILEFLEENGLSNPENISRDAFEQVSASHVRERLAMLQYAGLVYCAGLDDYELTTSGQLYLKGRIDAGNQPVPSVERVLRG